MASKLIMETTSPKTFEKYRVGGRIKHRESARVDTDRVWVFTDGSSSGWHAAVILVRGKEVRRVAKFKKPTATRNVGAELNALLLGLRHTPRDNDVTVVHDYLGVGMWLIGAWQIKNQEVQKQVDEARRIAGKKLLRLSFVHHGGHQSDKSDFTYWNCEADRLCSNVDLARLGRRGFYDD